MSIQVHTHSAYIKLELIPSLCYMIHSFFTSMWQSHLSNVSFTTAMIWPVCDLKHSHNINKMLIFTYKYGSVCLSVIVASEEFFSGGGRQVIILKKKQLNQVPNSLYLSQIHVYSNQIYQP